MFLLALTTYTIINQDVAIQSEVQREAIIGLGLVTDGINANQTDISKDLKATTSPLVAAVANLTTNDTFQISTAASQEIIDNIYVN